MRSIASLSIEVSKASNKSPALPNNSALPSESIMFKVPRLAPPIPNARTSAANFNLAAAAGKNTGSPGIPSDIK